MLQVDRTSEFAWQYVASYRNSSRANTYFSMFALIDAPIEIAVGTFFLYKLIGMKAYTP